MGLKAPGCRLAPTDDSLKTALAGPSSSQLFHIADTVTCPHLKVKRFSTVELFFPFPTISFRPSDEKTENLPVDKQAGLWLNDICIYPKDNDGKFAPFGCSREPADGVSRCGRIERSDS